MLSVWVQAEHLYLILSAIVNIIERFPGPKENQEGKLPVSSCSFGVMAKKDTYLLPLLRPIKVKILRDFRRTVFPFINHTTNLTLPSTVPNNPCSTSLPRLKLFDDYSFIWHIVERLTDKLQIKTGHLYLIIG